MAAVFAIKETDGTTGTIEVHSDRVLVTRKKLLRKDDVAMIPVKTITGAELNRKLLGRDTVTVVTHATTFEWKVLNGEELVQALHKAMFNYV